jgi:hypothetical protein
MQTLYNTGTIRNNRKTNSQVRATGANNTVIVGGLNYAFDLTGIATYSLTGFNIVYNTHPYDFGGKQVTPITLPILNYLAF